MVLYGVSRGAIAASMVATEEPDLRALILVAGIYDLAAAHAASAAIVFAAFLATAVAAVRG